MQVDGHTKSTFTSINQPFLNINASIIKRLVHYKVIQTLLK